MSPRWRRGWRNLKDSLKKQEGNKPRGPCPTRTPAKLQGYIALLKEQRFGEGNHLMLMISFLISAFCKSQGR